MKNYTWYKIAILMIIIIISSMFFIKPAITGYSIYNGLEKSYLTPESISSNIQKLKLKNMQAQNNISMLESMLELNQAKLNETVLALKSCLKAKNELNKEIIKINENNENNENLVIELKKNLSFKDEHSKKLIQKLNQTKKELLKSREEFDKFMKNAAYKICCKNKIDDPKINSFSIINNKIECLHKDFDNLNCKFN